MISDMSYILIYLVTGPTRADVSLINKRIHNHLVNVKSDIEILRRDPKSPLFHVKSFEELHLYVEGKLSFHKHTRTTQC